MLGSVAPPELTVLRTQSNKEDLVLKYTPPPPLLVIADNSLLLLELRVSTANTALEDYPRIAPPHTHTLPSLLRRVFPKLTSTCSPVSSVS